MSDNPDFDAFRIGRIMTRLTGIELLVHAVINATLAGPYVRSDHWAPLAYRVGLNLLLAVVVLGRTDSTNRTVLGLTENASYRDLARYLVRLIGCWMIVNAASELSYLTDYYHAYRTLYPYPAQTHAAAENYWAAVARVVVFFAVGIALLNGKSRNLIDSLVAGEAPSAPGNAGFGHREP